MQCRTEPSCERVIALFAVQVPLWRPELLLLAHIGYTAGGVRILDKFALRRPLDYRLVVLMAILPDIIDRFLYVFVIPGAESGRLFAHTLVFNLALFVVLVAIRRDLWIYGLLPIAHLALDLPVFSLCPHWGDSLHELLWPFLGSDLGNVHIPGGLTETAGQSLGERIMDRIGDPFGTYAQASLRSLLIEVAGLTVLTILAVWGRLYEWSRLRQLVSAGRL
jgi:hypothetical protein